MTPLGLSYSPPVEFGHPARPWRHHPCPGTRPESSTLARQVRRSTESLHRWRSRPDCPSRWQSDCQWWLRRFPCKGTSQPTYDPAKLRAHPNDTRCLLGAYLPNSMQSSWFFYWGAIDWLYGKPLFHKCFVPDPWALGIRCTVSVATWSVGYPKLLGVWQHVQLFSSGSTMSFWKNRGASLVMFSIPVIHLSSCTWRYLLGVQWRLTSLQGGP